MARTLENAPLVETVFELHWKLRPGTGDVTFQAPLPMGGLPLQFDPNYRLVFARLSEKLEGQYPTYVPLPQANLPDLMVPHVVQHRFQMRAGSRVPIVQIGPGVLTVNHGSDYSWDEFKGRIQNVLKLFYESYPAQGELSIERVSLKYIDAFPFDYENHDPVLFMQRNLSVGMELPASAFGDSVTRNATNVNFQVSFNAYSPEGVFTSNCATGMLDNQKTLFWQLWLTSVNPKIDFYLESDAWLDSAHGVIERWFFESLSGDLRRELLNE